MPHMIIGPRETLWDEVRPRMEARLLGQDLPMLPPAKE